MAIDQSVSLRVLANIREYEKEIEKMAPKMQKEARLAGRHLQKEFIKSQVAAAKEGQKAAQKSAAMWKKVGSAITVGLAVATVKSAISTYANWVTEINEVRTAQNRLSQATGIQRDTLAGLEQAFRSVGADSAEVTDQLQDFNEKLFDFGQGGGAAQEAFEAMGISQEEVANGTLKADAALRIVLERLPKYANEVEKAAFGQQLFSDRGLDVTNALENMPLDEAIAQAGALGLIMSDEAAEGAAEWARQTGLLESALQGTKSQLVDSVNLTDLLTTATTGLIAVTPVLVFWIDDITARLNSFTWAMGLAADAALIMTPSMTELADGLEIMGATQDNTFTSTRGLAAAMAQGRRDADAFAESLKPVADALDEVDDAYATSVVTVKESEAAQKKWIATQKAAAKEAAKAAAIVAAAEKAKADAAAARAKTASETVLMFSAANTKGLVRATEERAAAEVLAEEESLARFMAGIERGKENTERIKKEDEELLAAKQVIADQLVAIEEQAAALIADIAADATQRHAEEARKRFANAASAASRIAGLEAQLAEMRGETEKKLTEVQLEQSIERLKNVEERERTIAKRSSEAARKGFNVEKGIASAQAGLAATLLGIRMASLLAKGLGPLAIPVAAGIASAQLGLALAAIQRQQPPTFHQGGLVESSNRPSVAAGPDAIPTVQRPGEGTLTPQGLAAIGGANVLNAANRGETMSQSTSATDVFFDGRLESRIVSRGTRSGAGREAVRRQVEAGGLPGMARVY